MANDFSKEERVAFEDIMQGFEDALVLSRAVNIYRTGDAMMERAGDEIWRPQPYIAQSFNGTDQTSNFQDNTQLSVPATLGFSKSVPWTLDAKELRDQIQEGRIGDSAKQKLASDINVEIMNTAANEGTLVVDRTTAVASGTFSDIAECDAIMNEQGVQMFDRYCALSSRVYNGMAADLATASRSFMPNNKSARAYERAFVGDIASFQTYKLDYANQLAAATATGVTVNGASQFYTPQGTDTTQAGQKNVDNRTQDITLAATGTLAAGDCFTIAGVNAVHHITKQDTGQLKTFRVITGGGAGTITISPPIISGEGGTDAELQYQNVTATPANGAAITFLNANAAAVNPFWQKDALEILPGRYAIPANAGAAVLRATTDNGIECVWQKFYDIDTMVTKYRLDVLFGVVCKQPEMAGILIMGQ